MLRHRTQCLHDAPKLSVWHQSPATVQAGAGDGMTIVCWATCGRRVWQLRHQVGVAVQFSVAEGRSIVGLAVVDARATVPTKLERCGHRHPLPPNPPPPPPPTHPAPRALARDGSSGGGSGGGGRRQGSKHGKGRPAPARKGRVDDLDAALASLLPTATAPEAIADSSGVGSCATTVLDRGGGGGSDRLDPLLTTGPRGLNVDAEVATFMGARFGGGGGGAGRRHRPAHGRAATGRGLFVTVHADDDLAMLVVPGRNAGGMAMQRIPPMAAWDHATFDWAFAEEYTALHWQLDAAQSFGGGVDGLVGILQRCPWHVETNLALHEAYRLMGQQEAAVAHLRRAVVAIQQTLHTEFKPWAARCGLYRASHRDAAAMVRTLWRFALHAGRVGAPGTAWNACNIVLQLCQYDGAWNGPRPASDCDPHRALLLWDAFALRARAHEQVLALTDPAAPLAAPPRTSALAQPSPVSAFHWPACDVPAIYLPGMAFARALTLFRAQTAAGGGVEPPPVPAPAAPLPVVTPTPAHDLAHLYRDFAARWMGDRSADATLARAILLFPHAVAPLLSASGGDGGGGGGGGGAGGLPASCSASFGALPPPPGAAYSKLIDIFVMRQAGQWREAAARGWLLRIAADVAAVLQAGNAVAAPAAATPTAAATPPPPCPAWMEARMGGRDGVLGEAGAAVLARTQLFAAGHVADPALARAQATLAHYGASVPSGECRKTVGGDAQAPRMQPPSRSNCHCARATRTRQCTGSVRVAAARSYGGATLHPLCAQVTALAEHVRASNACSIHALPFLPRARRFQRHCGGH